MQSGGPSESSCRHRWGKYNSAIGSPKVASGPLLSEGVWLASAGNDWWLKVWVKVFFFPLFYLGLFFKEPFLKIVFQFANTCMITYIVNLLFLWTLSVWVSSSPTQAVSLQLLNEGCCKSPWSKAESSGADKGPARALLAAQPELSSFNRLRLMAPTGVACTGSLFFSSVCKKWDRTPNARDIVFFWDTLIVVMGEALARKILFTVIGVWTKHYCLNYSLALGPVVKQAKREGRKGRRISQVGGGGAGES